MRASPAIAIAAPQAATDQSTARPWCTTRVVHPLSSDATNAPPAIDESRSPYSTGPPPSRTASAGTSARGMPKIIASMSMPNTLITTVCPRRKRQPSRIDELDDAVPVATTGGAAERRANTASARQ